MLQIIRNRPAEYLQLICGASVADLRSIRNHSTEHLQLTCGASVTGVQIIRKCQFMQLFRPFSQTTFSVSSNFP